MIQAMIGWLLSEVTLHGLVSHIQVVPEVWDEANIQSPPRNAGTELGVAQIVANPYFRWTLSGEDLPKSVPISGNQGSKWHPSDSCQQSGMHPTELRLDIKAYGWQEPKVCDGSGWGHRRQSQCCIVDVGDEFGFIATVRRRHVNCRWKTRRT